jgi:hypothetical protein
MPNLTGKIDIVDSSGAVVMTWDAETGQASIGGGGFAKTGPHGHPGRMSFTRLTLKARPRLTNSRPRSIWAA